MAKRKKRSGNETQYARDFGVARCTYHDRLLTWHDIRSRHCQWKYNINARCPHLRWPEEKGVENEGDRENAAKSCEGPTDRSTD